MRLRPAWATRYTIEEEEEEENDRRKREEVGDEKKSRVLGSSIK